MDHSEGVKFDALRIAYQEVCQNHRAISEFRAKLLTLLPLASGAGIFLLLRNQGSPLDLTHLAAIGVFGFVITVGLFFHELRGILHCLTLIRLGRTLERQLGLNEGRFTQDYEYYNPTGSLNKTRKILHQLISPIGAAWIIYSSVSVAWLYVAAVGFEIPVRRFLIIPAVVLIAGGLWCALSLWKIPAGEKSLATR